MTSSPTTPANPQTNGAPVRVKISDIAIGVFIGQVITGLFGYFVLVVLLGGGL